MVKIDGAIELNDFYNQEGNLVSAKRVGGSFISILPVLPPEQTRNARQFEVDMLITNVRHVEADEEKKITEDYAVIKGAIFNFRKELLPVEFNVRDPRGMAYFESLDADSSNPVFTKVWGYLNCQTTVTTTTEESAFGEPIVRTQERKHREWVVNGTAREAYDFGDESVLTVEEVNTAAQNREVALAEIKRRDEEYRATRNGGNTEAAPVAKAEPKFNF